MGSCACSTQKDSYRDSHSDSKLNDFDIVFTQSGQKCTTDPNIIDGCDALRRLITAMEYYQQLDILNNQNDRETFHQFIMNIYQIQLLDDFNHLKYRHRDDMDEIYLMLGHKRITCDDMENCDKSMRHNRRGYINDQENIQIEDEVIAFYASTYDTIHFYLNHLFDAELRVISSKIDTDDKDESDDESESTDGAFTTILQRRKDATDMFNRIVTGKKFDLTAANTS